MDSGEETLIDPYASEAPEEFFAVLSEIFFEKPEILNSDYREVYEIFRRYYRQDPLASVRTVDG